MKRLNIIAILTLCLAFTTTLIACTQTTPQIEQAPQSTGDATNAQTAVVTSGNTVEFNMTAKNFEFSPNILRVKQGDRVIIHIVDSDTDHGFAIKGYDAQVKFGPGNSGKTLEFIADKTGTFTTYCNVMCGPGHREMQGQLIVE